MKKSFLSLVVLGCLVAATPVWACGAASCQKCAEKEKKCTISKLKKKVKLLWKNAETLGLTEKQLDEIKTIKHRAIKDLIKAKADKDIVMVDLKSAMYEDQIDTTVVIPLIEKKYEAKARSAKIYATALSDIQKTLNEKQRKQWKDLIREMKSSSDCPYCGSSSKGKVCPYSRAGKGSMKGSSSSNL